MEREARLLGAWVENKINSRTDYLVTGDRPGRVKTEAAMREGCTVIDEQQYRLLVAQREAEAAAAALPAEPDPALPSMPDNPPWLERLRQKQSLVRF